MLILLLAISCRAYGQEYKHHSYYIAQDCCDIAKDFSDNWPGKIGQDCHQHQQKCYSFHLMD